MSETQRFLKVALGTVLALVAACPARAQLTEIPLVNPGFEQVDQQRDRMPVGWGVYPGDPTPPMAFFITDEVAHSGQRAACTIPSQSRGSWLPLSNATFANTLDTEDMSLSQPRIVPGTTYVLSFWILVEGTDKPGVLATLRWTNEKGWVPFYEQRFVPAVRGMWTLITLRSTAPEGAMFACPILQSPPTTSPGRIAFDDVRLVEAADITISVKEPLLTDPDGSWLAGVEVKRQQPLDQPVTVSLVDMDTGQAVASGQGLGDDGQQIAIETTMRTDQHLQVVATTGGPDGAPIAGGLLAKPDLLNARLVAPSYRSTLYGGGSDRQVSAEVKIAAEEQALDTCRLTMTLQSTDGKTVLADHEIAGPARLGRPSLTTPALDEGQYSVEIVLDGPNRRLAATRLPLQVVDKPEPRVSVGPRQELVIDGKPVFPIGYYSIAEQDYARLAADGFTLSLSYNGDHDTLKRRLDLAQQAGLKMIVSDIHPNRDQETMIATVKALKDHPALLGHYLCDEPTASRPGQDADSMRALYEQARTLDPDHLSAIVHCRPAEFDLYSDCSDIYMVDPYPCRGDENPDLEKVVQYVRGAREAVNDSRPVWVVPQSFGHLNGPGTYRMPSVEEQRAQTYLALIHGANGIVWFTYTGFCVNSPERAELEGKSHYWLLRGTIPHCWPIRYQGITRIVREVRELEDVWLAPESIQRQDVLGGAGQVHTRYKEYEGDGYLFAVNIRNKPVTMVCRLPDVGGQASVIWEDRTVAIKNGIIVDAFEPYEVHAYRLSGE